MSDYTMGFVGGGNMARSMIGGLVNMGRDKSTIKVSEPDPNKRAYFENTLGIETVAENHLLVPGCDILILAVKPEVLRGALLPLQSILMKKRPLLLSIAAGARESDVDRWAGGGHAVVRAMPNTPALVGSGATGLFANPEVTTEQRNRAESLMRAVGVTVWLQRESLLDQVTALSGSGPAYFMLFMEALEDAGVAHGLDRDVAHLLIMETCLGAAKLAMESEENLAELRRRVTSPGGTTQKALQVMEIADIKRIINNAFEAASRRASEIGEQLGQN